MKSMTKIIHRSYSILKFAISSSLMNVLMMVDIHLRVCVCVLAHFLILGRTVKAYRLTSISAENHGHM